MFFFLIGAVTAFVAVLSIADHFDFIPEIAHLKSGVVTNLASHSVAHARAASSSDAPIFIRSSSESFDSSSQVFFAVSFQAFVRAKASSSAYPLFSSQDFTAGDSGADKTQVTA
jgi:hypothetical protein